MTAKKNDFLFCELVMISRLGQAAASLSSPFSFGGVSPMIAPIRKSDTVYSVYTFF